MPTLISLSRVINYGLVNLWRHRLLSLTAVVVMGISMSVLGLLLVVNQLADLSSSTIKDRVDVSIFFTPEATDDQVTEVKAEFEKFEEVKSINFISAEAALEKFKQRHGNDPLIQATLLELEANPLDSTLVVTAHDLGQYPLLIQKIERSRFHPLIKEINYEDNRALIERLDTITQGIRNFGVLLAVIFGCTTVLVTFNTLKLTIFSRREEIEIMRLVGASNWYIRGPYLVEGTAYGIFGGVISSSLIYPFLAFVEHGASNFFGFRLPQASFFHEGFWLLIIIQIGVGIGLGVISSVIATRRHLQI
ncbi:MAG: FtsX-like permease family protein [Candidatus Doudnabacteria bacterium]|nr:FtsX-like permease family protein [Candidatus Doudnabacteria bacterium]